MSLTTLLMNKDVRKKFSEEFPMKTFVLEKDILVPPRTNHYIIVGIAFDYLMRFYLQRLNPETISHSWIAEHAPEFVKGNKALLGKVTKIIVEAKKAYSHYLKSGRIERDILRSAILLAPLDLLHRAGVIDKNIGKFDNEDIKDLKKLISIVDPKIFIAKRLCIVNPTFREASRLVGGADADLLIDNMLIEIKTVKYLKLHRYHLNQIIGYCILSRIGGINGAPSKHRIDTLGIYYSRYGKLYTLPVKAVINERRLLSFIRWFRKRAIKEMRADIFHLKALSSLIELTGGIELMGGMKIEDIPPLIDLVEEKEIEGVLVEVLRVRRRNLALYIIEREGRKESVFHYKQLASQIPIGSEIKICFDEKAPRVYWRPGRLQVEREIKELRARIRQLKQPRT
jgi:hypothetical protein